MSESELPDDPGISDDAELWRRISADYHLVWDANQGRMRISSGAFCDNRTEDGAESPMSVVLGDDARAAGRSPHDVVRGREGLAMFRAKVPRDLTLRVARTPQPDEPHHGSVIGKKSKRVKHALATAAVWVVPPPI